MVYLYMNTLVFDSMQGLYITGAVEASRTETNSSGAEFRLYFRTEEGIDTAV